MYTLCTGAGGEWSRFQTSFLTEGLGMRLGGEMSSPNESSLG